MLLPAKGHTKHARIGDDVSSLESPHRLVRSVTHKSQDIHPNRQHHRRGGREVTDEFHIASYHQPQKELQHLHTKSQLPPSCFVIVM